MSLPLTGAGPSAGGYSTKVLGYSPLAYWPLWETTGSAAVCLTNSSMNGTYTGVSLNNAAGPDGKPTPLFDGSNDYVDIYSAAFASAFSGTAGTIQAWLKVFNVGVWTDTNARYAFIVQADANNRVRTAKNSANNSVYNNYVAGGTSETVTYSPYSETAWFHFAVTWDKNAGVNGEYKVYIDGSQVGSTQTSLGNWAGAPNAATTLIGAVTQAPANVWHGWIAHVAVWTSALTQPQLADLATV